MGIKHLRKTDPFNVLNADQLMDVRDLHVPNKRTEQPRLNRQNSRESIISTRKADYSSNGSNRSTKSKKNMFKEPLQPRQSNSNVRIVTQPKTETTSYIKE